MKHGNFVLKGCYYEDGFLADLRGNRLAVTVNGDGVFAADDLDVGCPPDEAAISIEENGSVLRLGHVTTFMPDDGELERIGIA